MIMLVWLIIGVAAAIAFGSFMAKAGRESSLWNAVAGAVGGFVGGYLFTMIGPAILGPGPGFIVGFLGAAIVAVIAVMILRAVMK